MPALAPTRPFQRRYLIDREIEIPIRRGTRAQLTVLPAICSDRGVGRFHCRVALGVTLMPESRARYLVFEIFGLADFVAAVGTGLTMCLLHDPRMVTIETLLIALIPFYGVGVSGARAAA